MIPMFRSSRRHPLSESEQDNTPAACVVLFFRFRLRAFREWNSFRFFIQHFTECVEIGYLNCRSVQRLETLRVVDVPNPSGVWMRRSEIESDLQYGEDTLPQPLFDALAGEVSGKG